MPYKVLELIVETELVDAATLLPNMRELHGFEGDGFGVWGKK
jgi:hypothetical protein